ESLRPAAEAARLSPSAQRPVVSPSRPRPGRPASVDRTWTRFPERSSSALISGDFGPVTTISLASCVPRRPARSRRSSRNPIGESSRRKSRDENPERDGPDGREEGRHDETGVESGNAGKTVRGGIAERPQNQDVLHESEGKSQRSDADE